MLDLARLFSAFVLAKNSNIRDEEFSFARQKDDDDDDVEAD
jgi:hypothetical protein